MIVRISAEAEHDLAAIADWIARDNAARALSFVRELRAACEGLADFPERFGLVPRYEAHGVMHRVHGNYLIFYLVGAKAVDVIHIVHGATDYAGVLFAE